MNTTTSEVINEYVSEIIINDTRDLGTPTQIIRYPSQDAYEEEIPLIIDSSFQDFQNTLSNDFVMPVPCVNCNEKENEKEKDMELPPPRPLTRMLTNSHLPDDEPEDDKLD